MNYFLFFTLLLYLNHVSGSSLEIAIKKFKKPKNPLKTLMNFFTKSTEDFPLLDKNERLRITKQILTVFQAQAIKYAFWGKKIPDTCYIGTVSELKLFEFTTTEDKEKPVKTLEQGHYIQDGDTLAISLQSQCLKYKPTTRDKNMVILMKKVDDFTQSLLDSSIPVLECVVSFEKKTFTTILNAIQDLYDHSTKWKHPANLYSVPPSFHLKLPAISRTLAALMDLSFRSKAIKESTKFDSKTLQQAVFWSTYIALWNAVFGPFVRLFNASLPWIRSYKIIKINHPAYTILDNGESLGFFKLFDNPIAFNLGSGFLLGPFATDPATFTFFEKNFLFSSAFLQINDRKILERGQHDLLHSQYWFNKSVVRDALMSIQEYNLIRKVMLAYFKKIARYEYPKDNIFASSKIHAKNHIPIMLLSESQAIESFHIAPMHHWLLSKKASDTNMINYSSRPVAYSFGYLPFPKPFALNQPSIDLPECWPDLVMLDPDCALSESIKSSREARDKDYVLGMSVKFGQ